MYLGNAYSTHKPSFSFSRFQNFFWPKQLNSIEKETSMGIAPK
jgi:hypothetical protein